MKLYTEEQLHTVMLLALGRHGLYSDKKQNQDLIDLLTPIELPSDEEIKKETPFFYTEWGDGFFEGATYVRDLIQGGNK
jgi:hypothetical protein